MRWIGLAFVAAIVVGVGGQGDRWGGAETVRAQADEGTVLTLLHNNDGESSLLSTINAVASDGETVDLPVGGAAAFATVKGEQVEEARAAGNSVLNVYAGDAFLASATLVCGQDLGNPFFDAVAQREIGYDLHIFGNHEFDYSPDLTERFVRAFGDSHPFISANLDFSGEPSWDDLFDADGLIDGSPVDGRTVGRSAIYRDPVTNEAFGVVGATTWMLKSISTARNVEVTPDVAATAAAVQAEIDRLQGEGIDRIILVTHLEGIATDRQLIALLRDVDIVISGGGGDLLQNPAIADDLELLPGDDTTALGTYPLEETDADGRTVYVAAVPGSYQYAGRLDAVFDDAGEVTEIRAETSYPRRVVPASDAAAALGIDDAVAPDAGVIANVEGPLHECFDGLAATTVAESEVLLDISFNGVSSRETNAGNLVSDSFIAAYDRYAADLGLPARSAENPVVAFENGGGMRQGAGDVLPRGGTVPGPITQLDTLDLLPFANFLAVIEDVPAVDIKSILESSARTLPVPGGHFLQLAGLEVVFDIAYPVGSRVREVSLADGTSLVAGGEVVAGAPDVTVVTHTFVAAGGDGYPELGNAPKVPLPLSYELALREYLLELPGAVISADDARYQPGGDGRISVIEEGPATPTATPAATTTATASPTATPTGSATATATASVTASATGTPGAPGTGSGFLGGPAGGAGYAVALMAALLAVSALGVFATEMRRRGQQF